jgi:hypothetical protein
MTSVSTQTKSTQPTPEPSNPVSQRITDFSQHPAAAALEKFRANPRVSKIRIIVPHDACPTCRHLEGEYEKDEVPELPLLDCSHPLGCRAFYEPKIEEVFP